MEKKHRSGKEAYTKPEVYTHEPLRNITAQGPGGGGMHPTMDHHAPH